MGFGAFDCNIVCVCVCVSVCVGVCVCVWSDVTQRGAWVASCQSMLARPSGKDYHCPSLTLFHKTFPSMVAEGVNDWSLWLSAATCCFSLSVVTATFRWDFLSQGTESFWFVRAIFKPMLTLAEARTTHKGLLQRRLDEDIYWIVPHVPPTTQSVKGPNWTEMTLFLDLFVLAVILLWGEKKQSWPPCLRMIGLQQTTVGARPVLYMYTVIWIPQNRAGYVINIWRPVKLRTSVGQSIIQHITSKIQIQFDDTRHFKSQEDLEAGEAEIKRNS